MRVEDAAFLGAHAFAHLALHLQDLLAGLDQGALQAVDLLGHFLLRNMALADRGPRTAHHEDPSARHPG